MEKKQTAVEWYLEQHNALLKLYNDSNMTALDLALAEDKLKFRAKQMEKEQIIDSYIEGFIVGCGDEDLYKPKNYYDNTYGGQE